MAVCICVTSCTGPGDDFKYVVDGDKVDFQGSVFRIADSPSPRGALALTPDSGMTPSNASFCLFEGYEKVQRNLNCKIEVIQHNKDDFLRAVTVGDDYADLINTNLNSIFEMYNFGYVLPLNEIESINLDSEKYGTPQMIEALTWKGDVVAAYPYFWGAINPNFDNGLWFNVNLFEKLRYPTPHELYERELWTWDALDEIGMACIDISTPTRTYYLSTLNDNFIRMMMLSNGGEYFKVTSTGRYEYGLTDVNVVDAIQKTHELYRQGLLCEYQGSDDLDAKVFADGNAALHCGNSTNGILTDRGYLSKNMEEGSFLWATMPKGPKGSGDAVGLLSNTNQFICATIDKGSDGYGLGLFMEELFKRPVDEDWQETFFEANIPNLISKNIFITQFENPYFDKVVFACQDDSLFEALYEAARTGSIRKTVEDIKPALMSELEDFIYD